MNLNKPPFYVSDFIPSDMAELSCTICHKRIVLKTHFGFTDICSPDCYIMFKLQNLYSKYSETFNEQFKRIEEYYEMNSD